MKKIDVWVVRWGDRIEVAPQSRKPRPCVGTYNGGFDGAEEYIALCQKKNENLFGSLKAGEPKKFSLTAKEIK